MVQDVIVVLEEPRVVSSSSVLTISLILPDENIVNFSVVGSRQALNVIIYMSRKHSVEGLQIPTTMLNKYTNFEINVMYIHIRNITTMIAIFRSREVPKG